MTVITNITNLATINQMNVYGGVITKMIEWHPNNGTCFFHPHVR